MVTTDYPANPTLMQFIAARLASRQRKASTIRVGESLISRLMKVVMNLAGFSCLTMAGFTWCTTAGLVVAGLSCFAFA